MTPRCQGEICKRCLRNVVIGFSVDDEIWDKVSAGRWNILCPQCFDEEAQRLHVEYRFGPVYPVSWSDWMTPAGPIWCDRYPTSRDVADLKEPFRSNVNRFLAELAARGCVAKIAATWRPEQRAWLMHYAWDIAHGAVLPGNVPARPDLDIVWTLDGARAMVAKYGLKYRPSLASRHIEGRAIDMDISGWTGTPDDLYALGASFGVHKLRSDPPHWSDDGH